MRVKEWILPACKPGSVECRHSDGHSSRSTVTRTLEQPTRSVFVGVGHPSLPIWPCSRWGLPSHACYQSCGELLPHRFTLACVLVNQHHRRFAFCCTFRQCFQHCPDVIWQRALWSPDFPRTILARDRPTDSIHVKANGMFGLQHFDHHAGL